MIASILTAQALGMTVVAERPQVCSEPYRVTREEILQAMSAHGKYSLTATTTSMLFEAEALLAIVRRRQREDPGNTRLLIDQNDWFPAHQQTAGVTYAEMSETARAGFEHHQDAVVDYGPQVLAEVIEGDRPLMSLDVTIFWPDSAGAPSGFSYKDTLSVPKVDVYDDRVIHFKLLQYDDMLLFDEVTGISVKPHGFLSAVFAVLGKPDLKQTRLAVSSDHWQVVRARVNVFAGISKTGTATIEPEGRGHEHVPLERPDLLVLKTRLEQPLKLKYGELSCQVGRGRKDGVVGPGSSAPPMGH
jgi:hypothetical protein